MGRNQAVSSLRRSPFASSSFHSRLGYFRLGYSATFPTRQLGAMSANSNFLDVSLLTDCLSLNTRSLLTRRICSRLQKACELVKQAIDADVKQDWAEAFKLYKCAAHAPPTLLTRR